MKQRRIIAIGLLLALILAGCGQVDPTTRPQNTVTPSTPTATVQPTTQPTTPPTTVPTQPDFGDDDGVRTVRLVTEGGMIMGDRHIVVYADEAMSERITTIHTDADGMATFKGEPGGVYYMAADKEMEEEGFFNKGVYQVKDAYTELVLEIRLKQFAAKYEVGDIIGQLDKVDWNGNQFRLSDCMAAGKPCIIASVRTDISYETLQRLQKIYEEFGDRLEILLFSGQQDTANMGWAKHENITFPGVGIKNCGLRWDRIADFIVVDRYGRIVLLENIESRMDEDTLRAIAEYYTDENYIQDRVFANTVEMWRYLDSLKYTETATYQVKVVGKNGEPLAGVSVTASYRNYSSTVQTNQLGIATWELPVREDIMVTFYENTDHYVMENQGYFEPGTTEKTMVKYEKDILTYTIRAVDIHGNPVAGVPFMEAEGWEWRYTDENGMAQFDYHDAENPFYIGKGEIMKGYYLDSVSREGTVFTVLMRALVTYTVKVVDEQGVPMRDMFVKLKSELKAESDETDGQGIVTLEMPEDDYAVTLSNIYSNDDIYDRYNQYFEITAQQREITLVWVDQTVSYTIKVVDRNGNPVANAEIEVLMEQDDGSAPYVVLDENGTVTIRMRPGRHKIGVSKLEIKDGSYTYTYYGSFEIEEGQTEIVIVIGDPVSVTEEEF